MGKKSSPKAPDYTKAAEATAQSSQEAQTRADWANRPTIQTPWGQESWQATAARDPSTGQPITQWSQNTRLNPLAQSTLDSTMTVDRDKALLAQGMMGRAADATATPFDWNNLTWYGQAPEAGGLQAQGVTGAGQGIMAGLDTSRLGAMPQADAAERQRIENMMFDRMKPQHQQAQAGLEGKLANMGLTRGSAAWNKELQRMGDQQSRERFNAMEIGGNEMQRLFGMGMQGRQQGFNELMGAGQFQNAAQQQGFQQRMGQSAQNFGQQAQAGQQNFAQGMDSANYYNRLRQQQIAEQQMQRQMPLNELNALLSGTQVGQLNTPDFNASRSAGGTDYSGAANQQYNANLDAYNARQSQTQGMLSGLGGLAQTGMMMFSDRRLKRNIQRVGMTQAGLPVYTFNYWWSPKVHLGVMADEAREMFPEAVRKHWTGYLMVDYSKVK